MKKLNLIFIVLFCFAASVNAQEKAPAKATAKPKTTVKAPVLKSCTLESDAKNEHSVTLEQALKWAELDPLVVICNDKKTYKLKSFEIQFINKEPFSTEGFGVGEGGLPILAHNKLKEAKVGDALLLKKVTYLDSKGAEQKLPNIVFSIK